MHPIPRPRIRSCTFCFLVLVLLAGRAGAATLADYRHRLSHAIAVVQQLQGADDDEDTSQLDHFVIPNTARIRAELPASETVTSGAQSVVVDNAWLYEALTSYEKSSNTRSQRAAALARIEERLRALEERIVEAQRANLPAGDKDGDKGRLAEILRRPDFNKPVVAEESALSRLLNRLLRWLSRLLPQPKPMAPGGSPFISGVAQILVIGVCLVAIAFLIWKMAPRLLKNRRGKKKQKREARIVLGERLEPDQTSADLLGQAEALARHGDLRAAIRKAYIAFLCELGDRKIVSLAQHKTNRDYLNSVRERARLYSSMRQLTSSFELHWYGFQPAVESDWIEFRDGYQKALNAGSGG